MVFYADGLKTVHLVGDETLALDVALIFYSDLRCLCNLVDAVRRHHDLLLQRRHNVGEELKRHLRTRYEIRNLGAAVQRRGAYLFESGVHVGRFHRCVGAERCQATDVLLLLQPPVVTFARCEAEVVRQLRQSGVGVVLSEQDAVFCARGEHAVWLVHTLRREVVDEHAYITLVAFHDQRVAARAE